MPNVGHYMSKLFKKFCAQYSTFRSRIPSIGFTKMFRSLKKNFQKDFYLVDYYDS